MSYDFKFGGRWLSEFSGVTTEKPKRDVAQYDFSLLDIPGKSGSEYIDNHRYKNVPFERKIGFSSRRTGYIPSLADSIIDWIAYAQGYQDFEDTMHPGMVTRAALINFPEVVSSLLDRITSASLKFSRQPFWYCKDDLKYRELDLSRSVFSFINPFKLDSEPIIHIVFSSSSTAAASISYSITTGGVSTTYSYADIPVSNSVNLYIDCEQQEVRSGSGSSTVYLDQAVPSGFDVGETTFQLLSGGGRISQILVAPRWRCL